MSLFSPFQMFGKVVQCQTISIHQLVAQYWAVFPVQPVIRSKVTLTDHSTRGEVHMEQVTVQQGSDVLSILSETAILGCIP